MKNATKNPKTTRATVPVSASPLFEKCIKSLKALILNPIGCFWE